MGFCLAKSEIFKISNFLLQIMSPVSTISISTIPDLARFEIRANKYESSI